jgi:hypothetical protein
MSWSFSCIGKPAAVAAALDEFSATQNGQSKLEFDAAAPHLKALVSENFLSAQAGSGYVEPIIRFEASGSGSARGEGENAIQITRQCKVSIEPIWTKLV